MSFVGAMYGVYSGVYRVQAYVAQELEPMLPRELYSESSEWSLLGALGGFNDAFVKACQGVSGRV